jgi:hypothetical protein
MPDQHIVLEQKASSDVLAFRRRNALRFQALAKEWQAQHGAMSSITEISMLPSYQRIIGIGEDAIPLILQQLKAEGDEPDQWFWALRAIAEENPVAPEDQGDFLKMAKAWIRWGEGLGYAR